MVYEKTHCDAQKYELSICISQPCWMQDLPLRVADVVVAYGPFFPLFSRYKDLVKE